MKITIPTHKVNEFCIYQWIFGKILTFQLNHVHFNCFEHVIQIILSMRNKTKPCPKNERTTEKKNKQKSYGNESIYET